MKRRRLLGPARVNQVLHRMARAIARRNRGVKSLALVGIKRRGAPLAHRLAGMIEALGARRVEVGAIDINLYRDDLQLVADAPVVRGSELDFDINRHVIVLVDDVLFTGRTVRAALSEILDYGRPRAIQLAVLIERGGRELPICPDFVGRIIDTKPADIVDIHVKEEDGEDAVWVERRPRP